MGSDGIREIGVGMLGYAFMGKAHSNALPQDRLHDLAAAAPAAARGASQGATRRRWARRPSATGSSAGRPTGRTSSPIRRSASSTTSARTRSTPSPRSPPRRPASTSSARSRSGATRPRATRSGGGWRRPASSTCARFNYRFVPAVRLARELIDAGELGEIRHFRGRYLQDWGDDRRSTCGASTAQAAGSGALGDLAAHVVDLARYLVGEIDEVGGFLSTFVAGREVDDAVEATVRVRERRRRHARGDAVRARPPQRVPVGDQRHEGLARLRHGAAERAAGLPGRRRRARAASRRSSSRRRAIRSGSTGGRPGHIIGWGDTFVHELHHFLDGDRRATRTSRRTARPSRTATGRPRCATRSSAPANPEA